MAKTKQQEKEKADADANDRESRTVRVRALKRGFYPAEGRIQEEGDEFDYVLNRDAAGKVEEELPSWMEAVDGNIPTRSLGLKRPEQPTVIEIHGTGPDATVTKKAPAAK